VPGDTREDLVAQLTHAIYRTYVDNGAAQGDLPRLKKSMRPWDELPYVLRQPTLRKPSISAPSSTRSTVPLSRSQPPRVPPSRKPRSSYMLRWSTGDGVQERQAQGHVHGPNREGVQPLHLVDWQYLGETARHEGPGFYSGTPRGPAAGTIPDPWPAASVSVAADIAPTGAIRFRQQNYRNVKSAGNWSPGSWVGNYPIGMLEPLLWPSQCRATAAE